MMKKSEVIFLCIIVLCCVVYVLKDEPVCAEKEPIYEQEVEIDWYDCLDCNWEVQNRKTRKHHRCIEPNEPEYKILSISERVNQAIPTWPQYIELEKDLKCFIPDDNDVSTVGDGMEHILLTKGTKIYFK